MLVPAKQTQSKLKFKILIGPCILAGQQPGRAFAFWQGHFQQSRTCVGGGRPRKITPRWWQPCSALWVAIPALPVQRAVERAIQHAHAHAHPPPYRREIIMVKRPSVLPDDSHGATRASNVTWMSTWSSPITFKLWQGFTGGLFLLPPSTASTLPPQCDAPAHMFEVDKVNMKLNTKGQRSQKCIIISHKFSSMDRTGDIVLFNALRRCLNMVW